MSTKWTVASIVAAFVVGFGLAWFIYQLTPLPWALNYFWLLVAGGSGGTVQALVNGKDKLRFPRYFPDTREWDAGFLSDLAIGMIAATASLLFALALLSDKFFGGNSQPNDIPIPAWGRIVAFGVLTGYAGRQLLPSLSKRLSDMLEQEAQIKAQAAARAASEEVKEVGRKEIEAARSQAELARLANATALRVASAEAAPAASSLEPLVPLKQLAKDYAAIRSRDKRERVVARTKVADAMSVVVAECHVTSETLAKWIETEPEKELVLPLATLIAARPAAGDAERLFDAVDRRIGTPQLKSGSKFIMYRVLLAITALRDGGKLPTAELGRARAIAETCRDVGDESLRQKALVVLEQLG